MACNSLISAGALILSLGLFPASGPDARPPNPGQNARPEPPPEMIQANAAVQGFAQALRDADWGRAISYCSATVQAKAKSYPSPEAFFRDVVPIKDLVPQIRNPIYYPSSNPVKGGPWGTHALACRVAKLEVDPADKWELMAGREVWWQARLERTTDARCVIDFPTAPLESHIEKRLSDLRRVRAELIAAETALEPQLKGLQTRLTPLTKRFRAGEPMLFRLELINGGSSTLVYDRSTAGVNGSFLVTTSEGTRAKYTGRPVQTAEGHEIINPGQTVTLLDNWDLANQYRLTEPGRYIVQFRGTLSIGETHPQKTIRIHRARDVIETVPARGRSSQRLFPSNSVEIEIAATYASNSG